MQIPREIFRMYDIRGLIDQQITPELAEALGRAFVTMLQNEKPDTDLKIVVGRDMRQSSIELEERLIKGLTESGADVLEIGLVSTPAFYFGVGHLEADGGVMVSASHNPAAYNGFKMTREKAIPVSGESGILDLADIIENESFIPPSAPGKVEKVEDIPKLDVEAQVKFAGDGPVGTPKIVVDSGNGMGAQYCDILFKKLGLEIDRMFWEFDGSFPNHEADPMKAENTVDACARVKEIGADLGILLDGDGDRIYFIDEQGEVVDPAIIRGILSQMVLKKYPGAAIGYDIRPGKITEDMIVEAGGRPFVTRVGHSLIKEKMRQEDAVYGGESSGHFFYRFETGTFEGPVTAIVHLLQALHASGQTFSEFIAPRKKYVHSGEINFVVEDKDATVEKIKERFKDGELNELDGVTISYPEFWFNVRGSNTEPKLRLNLEAVDRATMEKRRDEVKSIIEG